MKSKTTQQAYHLQIWDSLKYLLPLFLLTACTQPEQESPISQEKRIIAKIKFEVAQKIKETYPIKIFGESIAMPGGIINNMGFNLSIRQVLSIAQARALLIDCTQLFLEKVNSNELIRPYLREYPFTSKNITIILSIYGPKGENLYTPVISSAIAAHGKVWYATRDKDQEFGYASRYEETYEEALQLVDPTQRPLKNKNSQESPLNKPQDGSSIPK